jgi:hypothetical protein
MQAQCFPQAGAALHAPPPAPRPAVPALQRELWAADGQISDDYFAYARKARGEGEPNVPYLPSAIVVPPYDDGDVISHTRNGKVRCTCYFQWQYASSTMSTMTGKAC